MSRVAPSSLEVIDEESQLLRIVSSELRNRPAKLADTLADLVDQSYAGMASWVQRNVPGIERERAENIATIAMNAHRTMPHFLGLQPLSIQDDRIIGEWVEMVAGRIEQCDPTRGPRADQN